MKIITIFFVLVTGTASYSINTISFHSPLNKVPQITRVVNYPRTSVRAENSYGRQLLKAKPNALRTLPVTRLRKLPVPSTSNSYSFRFESGNGIKSQESGTLKHVPMTRVINGGGRYRETEESVEAVPTKSGETSWCSPEGLRFTLTYTADETGYHPTLTKGICDSKEALQTPAYGPTRYTSRNTY